jgi:hypothetical protein
VEVKSTPSMRHLEELILKKSKALDLRGSRGCGAVAAVMFGI